MPWRDWNDDDELLLDIGDALRCDRREQRVLDAARQIRVWRTAALDRPPAVLLYDSHMDRMAAAGPRPTATRSLIFALGEARVEIDVCGSGLDGRLIPPESGAVRLLDHCGPVAETTADDLGCFTFAGFARGPMRIECRVAGRRLATQWITV